MKNTAKITPTGLLQVEYKCNIKNVNFAFVEERRSQRPRGELTSIAVI